VRGAAQRPRRLQGICIAGATLLLAGCATTPIPDLATFAERPSHNSFEILDRGVDPPQTLVLPLVQDRQTAGPSCGAHALASVMNYWGERAVQGSALYESRPPAHPAGYSIAELLAIAGDRGLLASAVRLSDAEVVAELDNGRPVILPVRIPAIYLTQRTFPGADLPIIGVPANLLTHRVARVSEWTNSAMIDHYLVAAGHADDRLVVLEPILGYRTMSFTKLARYRRAFGNAAIVMSQPPELAAQLPVS
jgi:predicted double-glycine peptidase